MPRALGVVVMDLLAVAVVLFFSAANVNGTANILAFAIAPKHLSKS
jgi:hypothetical protein